ncbi:CvfB family protein [Xanthovirga aplysinae]|uniref:CvfB family protein n=1 Tax=Xanthovirga aplysinae TaxID=2529853 RepID=UPI0012BC7158|nr:S1-like domain-containing RNA-binding protein [Xanthovirga aplysinae]MTI29733.1 GntR family transcriptional regulator [Xanthovirga aplysinae]
MLKIGKFNQLKVGRSVQFGLYLESDKGDILLPNKYVPKGTQIGDVLNVFIYTDSEDRLIATTLQPKAVVDEFVALEVKDTVPFGAFLDWGLEKDLLVPKREQHRPMREGEVHVVRLCLDYRTNRVIGVAKLNAFFNKNTKALKKDQEVDVMVYGQTDLGWMVIINQEYSGMLYKNEVFEPLTVGDIRKGFIKKLREDGKIDVSLQPQGFQAVVDSKEKILLALKDAGGFLPYHDKTEPERIKATFQMSKKIFKKIIGNLQKDGKLTISDKGIHLTE